MALLILNDPNVHTIEEDRDGVVEMMVLNQFIRNEAVGLGIDHNLDLCKDQEVRTTLGVAPVIRRGGQAETTMAPFIRDVVVGLAPRQGQRVRTT